MAVIAIRLPNELIDQIDEWGAERGMTRSEVNPSLDQKRG